MTNYEKLQAFLNEKQCITGLRKRNLRESVQNLLDYGMTHTGSSGWISARRGASKEVWTEEIHSILDKLGIAHECGNNAPRGGANGEYVKVTSPAFLKEVKRLQAERKALMEAEKKAAAEKAATAEMQRKAHAKRMDELVEENIDKFKSIDYKDDELRRTMYHHEGHIYFSKKSSTEAARIISKVSGVDYQICIWFVRGKRFNEIANQ